ncbi:TIGR03620 family F420-dependent LLM class oxidoreductase [Actinopolymorpha pittospori]
MTKLELGPVGIGLDYVGHPLNAVLDAASELEGLGFSSILLSGGANDDLSRVAEIVRRTDRIPVFPGIFSVDLIDRASVARTYAEVQASDPDRFLVGLGGAHGPRPIQTLAGYLDELDTLDPTVPAGARILAALGPRMLELSRDRAAGALPILVTPDYTAQARELLGPDTALIVQHFVAVDTDPERARAAARGPLSFLRQIPGYARNFARMGFSADDVAHLSDRMVDALVARGDIDAIGEHVDALLRAGADQVALTIVRVEGELEDLPAEQWRRLAQIVPATAG